MSPDALFRLIMALLGLPLLTKLEGSDPTDRQSTGP